MPHDHDMPMNPLPNPDRGEMNQPSPVNRAQDANWMPYESQLGLAEPEGDHDIDGLREAPETLEDRTAEHGRAAAKADQRNPAL